MALNISPGDDAVAQEAAVTGDQQAPVAENAENVPAAAEQPEQPVAEGAPVPDEEAAEPPVATEQAPTAEATQELPVAEPAAEEDASSAAEESAPVNDDAHDLIDELEDLIGRAHHFENAGIERLRAGGLALIERIRDAI
ncbi:hypothetical protein G6K93_07725 [Agrobacterium rhizogenes]|nr:hypothetical protein [Rhizobium rhizogenes]